MMRWLKRKSLFYTVLYVLIMGIIGAILYTRYEILTEKYTQRHIDMFDQRIESYQLMQQRMLDSYFHLFFESPQIALIMEEASRSEPSVQAVLRRELMGRTEEMFRALQGFDVRLLFFHLPGSVGFLRVHEPEKFGDSLAASRPSVLLAQNSQKKVVTFETGKLFDGFRTIYPLFHHGKFVGTVELAYPFAALKNQAMRQSPGAYTFLIKRSVQEGKATSADINKHYEDSLFGSEYLEDKESALHKGAKGYKKGELEALLRYHQTTIQKAFKKGRLQGIKLLYKESYSLLTLKPVKEIGGEDAAYMVEITPNHTFFADQWNQFVVLVTLIAFLLAVLMWYIYRFNRSVILLEQYKNAIDDSMIVSKTDRKGVITYVNPNFVAVSGYDEEDLLGKPHSIVRHPDTPASVFKEMWSTIRKGKNWQGVLQNRTKAGKSYYVQSLIAPIVDENGEILEYMGLREDITEIENSRLEAHEAQRIKAAFVANMSHEIRTPINGIVGFVHLLSKSHLDAVQRRYVSIIESSLESLMHIVNDVLDFSKIEEGKIELDIVECAPKAPLDAVYELFSPQAGVKQIDYTLVMDDRLYGCLMLDMLRIKQVISNLISNALKFTPEEGAVTFKIEVVEDTASHQMLRFSVIDTGIGIPKEKQDKIFEKFTQADVSTTRQFGGTGLGLSIANAMVSLMGGVLRVHSEEGKGSTFSFELNAQKCDTFQETAAALENDSLNTAAIPLSLSVLVVDDYEINQMLIGELLRYHYGIQADFSHNGAEAVERVRHHRYDLVLMDINMPVMDGIEATRIILSEDPTLTIVALTANVLEEDREKFQRAGMKDCLMKPLDLDALHQVLMHVHDIREKE